MIILALNVGPLRMGVEEKGNWVVITVPDELPAIDGVQFVNLLDVSFRSISILRKDAFLNTLKL